MLNINVPATSNTQSISNLVFYTDTTTDSIGDFFTLVLTNGSTQKTQIINFDPSNPVIINRNTRYLELRLTVSGSDLTVSPANGAVNLLAPPGNWTYQLWQSSASLLCLDPSCSYDFNTPDEWLQYRQDWSGGILSEQKDDGQAFLIQNNPAAREIVYTPYTAGNEDLESVVYVQPGLGITAGIIYGGGRIYDIQGGTAYVVALSDLGTYPFGCAPTVTDFTGDTNDLQRTQSIAEACPYDGTAAVAALNAETGGLTDWSLGSSGDFARIVANGYGGSVGLVPGNSYWTNQDFPYNGQTNNIRRSYQLDNTTYWSRINGRTNLIPNDNSFTVPSVVSLTNSTDTVPGTPITTVEGFTKTSGVNLLLQSQTLNTTWSQNNVSVVADAVAAPDGTTTADYVVGLTADNVRLSQGVGGLLTDGTPYMASAYVRAGSYSPALTIATSGFVSGVSAYYDLITGTYSGFTVRGTEITLVGTPGIQSVGSGWYRIFFAFTTTNSSVETRLYSTDGVLNQIPVAGRNLLLRSQEFDVTPTWSRNLGGTGLLPVVTANSVISPDGNQTAETVVFDRGAGNTINDRSFLEQSLTIPTTGTYTFSVYAKASAAGDVGKQIFIRLGAAGGLIPITLTANWTRYSQSEASVASGSQGVQIGNRGTFTADNSVSVDLWGAQVNPGSSALTYIPTGTVSTCSWAYWWGTQLELANIPAPCSVTNLCLQSEAWNVSPWVATSGSQGATVSGNVTTSPDGTTNADKLIESAVTGNHFCFQSLTLTSGTTYTASFFVKASERTRGRLRITGSIAYWDVVFNLTSATVTGGTNSFIENYGNGWYRIGATFTANQASNNFIVSLLDDSGNISYTGDGTSGFFVWGAQLDPDSVATTYIPTTTVPITSFASCYTNPNQVITTPTTYSVTTTVQGGVDQYIQQIAIGAVPSLGATYTLSRYFKVGNTYGSVIQTSLGFNASANWGGTSWAQIINLNPDGTVTLGPSTLCTSTVTNVGSGWYRVGVSFYMGTSTPTGSNSTYLMRILGTQLPGTFFFTAGGMFENAGEISPWVDSGLVSTYNSIISPDGTDPFYTNFTSSLAGTGPWITGANWNTLSLRQSVGSLPLSTNTPLVILAKKPAGSSLNYLKVELNNSVDPNMWITVDLRDGTHTVAAQSQTNSILQSENFQSASWGKLNVLVRNNATLSPGGNLAQYVVKQAAGLSRVNQSINASPGSVFWVSIWAKAGNTPNVYCLVSNLGETVISSFNLNLNTGNFTGSIGSYVTQRETVVYQNGWRRINLRCTIPAGQNNMVVNFTPGDADPGGSFIFIWGCSVTQTSNPIPPDYIQTTTTALTRSGYTHNVIPSSNGYYWIVLRRTSTNNATMNCFLTPLSTPEGDGALTGNPADKILIGGCGLSVLPQVPFPRTFDFPATYPAGAWDAIARDDAHLHLFPKDTNLPVRLFREFPL